MTNKQAYAGLLDELRWLKRVTEDDTSNIYGRTDEAISSLLKRVGELEGALESAPIPGCNEPMARFYERMNDWLNTTYRAALNSDAPLSIGEEQ